jgi:hypothetical protein
VDEKAGGISTAEERAEVDTVLASTLFSRAPALSRILRYICEQHFQGKANDIKEYSIAVEALGRTPEFRPGEDSIVRVEAARLRRHLKRYYETDGATHRMQIRIADVGYAPQFLPVGGSAAPGEASANGEGSGATAVPVVVPAVVEPEVPVAKPEARPRPRRWALAVALAALAVLGIVFAVVKWTRGQAAEERGAASPAVATAPGSPVRIRVGAPEATFLDANASQWLGDAFFTGGTVFDRSARKIFRTFDAALYQQGREGSFRYSIPLKPGLYELHLHFAETFHGQGPSEGAEKERLFNIDANGKRLLGPFDVANDAGGSNTADEKVFRDVSPAADGYLHLEFTPVRNGAMLNGIEVLPGLAGRMRPVRIVCAKRPYSDRHGRFWSADRYFYGGRLSERSLPVTGTDDVGIYANSRWGNFNYAIPVADGQFRLRLHFAEGAWGAGGLFGGGIGSRIFDIYCNGRVLRGGLDLLKEAGGQHKAVVLSFSHLKPNAQGKLVLSFVPIVDYAVLSAIEVEDEGE